MTSEGHPYAIFRRALDNGNAPAAWSAAAELPQINLEDALALCLLTAERQPARFERAVARWIARYLQEEPHVELEELRLTTELLVGLRGPHSVAAVRALRELFAARGRVDLVGALDSWHQQPGRRPGAGPGATQP
jgi:hypothetical protein